MGADETVERVTGPGEVRGRLDEVGHRGIGDFESDVLAQRAQHRGQRVAGLADLVQISELEDRDRGDARAMLVDQFPGGGGYAIDQTRI
jgi:hypothetical protein